MNLVLLLEEPSAREMLKGLLPRLVHHSRKTRPERALRLYAAGRTIPP